MDRIFTKLPPAIPEMPTLKRVAAYTRVSTDKDAMLHSLSAQVSYYSEFIQNTPGWAYAGVYCEEGKTGTLDNRPEFQRLLADCRAGLIDLILVKAISRLARNTVTFLATVRELKELGIDIYFQNERISAMSATGELMMTLIAAFMQEESRTVSENCKWHIHKQFEEGKLATLRFMYGYRVRHGQVAVEPDEAAVVRSIFADYLGGIGATEIARRLQGQSAETLRGGKWTPNRVRRILLNEKYTGNALLQKTYVVDHLSKQVAVNRGQLPSYFAEGTHPPIIDTETFERAQQILAQNGEQFKPAATPHVQHPFTSLIHCGCCGKHYTRKQNHGRAIWHCSTYMMFGKDACAAKAVPEDVLTMAVYAALGMTGHGLDDLQALIVNITVPTQGKLVFELWDGSQIEHEWELRSRKDSWNDAAREQARQHAQKRWNQ